VPDAGTTAAGAEAATRPAPTSPPPEGGSLAGLGVMLPSFDPFRRGTPPLVEGARRAEALGFDSGWVGDHLSFHPPVLEAVCSVAASAAVTSRLRLGFGVLLLPMRPLVWTAAQLGTIHALAPDRLVLGVGVGGEHPPEWEAAGVPLAERGRRLDEALAVLPHLLAGEPVDHPGPLLPTRSPRLDPVPGRMLPLLVGGRSDAALERTARVGDGWMATWMSPATVGRCAERIAERAAALGRPAPETVLLVFAHVDDDRDRARGEAAALIGGQYGMPFERVERWTALGDVEEVAGFLAGYRQAGVRGVVLIPAARDPLEQYERFVAVRRALDG
jgi:alkanesulfonate monooxygenase SsuD/methylene tetrahydromethanopterin reductase-like flavin-dependent oxidoreductase (luciferase family)